MADDPKTEDPGKALKERSMREFAERTQGKPTPTQDENDRAKLGEHVIDKEPDGSPIDESMTGPVPRTNAEMSTSRTRTSQAQQPQGTDTGGYQTRQTTANKPPTT